MLAAVLFACGSSSSGGGVSDGGLSDRAAGSSSGGIGDADGIPGCGLAVPAACASCVASTCCASAQTCANTAGCASAVTCATSCFGSSPDASVPLTCVADCVNQGPANAQYYAQQIVDCLLACRLGGSGC